MDTLAKEEWQAATTETRLKLPRPQSVDTHTKGHDSWKRC